LEVTNNGLIFELNDSSLLMAKTSSLKPPFTLQALKEAPLGDDDAVAEAVADFADLRKGQYAQGICGVFPPNRFLQRVSVDQPAKLKDPAYLPALLKDKHKIEYTKNRLAILSAKDGLRAEPERVPLKELIFCGAPPDEFDALQEALVSYNAYPQKLELGTLATMAALMHYCRVMELEGPVLMVEISAETSHAYIFDGSDLNISRPIPYGTRSMYPIVQKELGLKDEESAKKLFYSNTFDFTEMATALLKNLMKELQASCGYYEVQTGHTIEHLFIGNLPKNLHWVTNNVARAIGVEPLKIDYLKWLASLGGNAAEDVDMTSLDARWVGVFGLLGDFSFKPSEQAIAQTPKAQPEEGGAQ